MQLRMCILQKLSVTLFSEIKRGWIYWQIVHPQSLFYAYREHFAPKMDAGICGTKQSGQM